MNKTLLELEDFEGSSKPKQDKIKKDPVLEKIINTFEEVRKLTFQENGVRYNYDMKTLQYYLQKAQEIILKNIKEDILSDHIQGFIDFISGKESIEVYISALLNLSKDNIISLDLSEYPSKFPRDTKYFGSLLKNKTLEIKGDVSYNLGNGAENSRFIVQGLIGHSAGDHSKNCFFIADEFDDCAGNYAKNGFFKAKIFKKYAGQVAQFSTFEGIEFWEESGYQAYKCIFRGKRFGKLTGYFSRYCEFHADEIKSLAEGTSKFFIKGVKHE